MKIIIKFNEKMCKGHEVIWKNYEFLQYKYVPQVDIDIKDVKTKNKYFKLKKIQKGYRKKPKLTS